MSGIEYFRGQKVLVTGHTGFKGSWLCEWLLQLGAEVHGYALDPKSHEVLFDQLGLAGRLASDTRGDLADRNLLEEVVKETQPAVVLHLAAQALVRESYESPVETFATNVLGTVHLLEAVRLGDQPCTVVCITTDKCYENREWLHAYREEDPMGGHDPYSASKGAAEIGIASYRRSFFSGSNSKVRLASARAGNVIGGGDWSPDRIVPDAIRALQGGHSIPVRNKVATRPWQHVLEPLGGYLTLASQLALASPAEAEVLASGFNFGPTLDSNRTVAALVEELLKSWPGDWEDRSDPRAPHEASKLNLAIDKAHHLLNWQPRWDFAQTIIRTADWYRRVFAGDDPVRLTQEQIAEYSSRG